jgi:hypothetical protein
MTLKDVLMAAEEIGFTQVVLPFVIVFTVVFAVLQKTKVLGIDSKGNPKANYNAMVAFVIGFFVLIMFKTLTAITIFTRYVVILLVAFVFLGIILSFIGGKVHMSTAVKFIGLVLISFVLLEALVMADIVSEHAAYSIITPLLVTFFVAAAVVSMFTSGGEKPGKKPGKKEEKKEPGKEKRKESKRQGEEAELMELSPGERAEL